jgi:hypothetical protein
MSLFHEEDAMSETQSPSPASPVATTPVGPQGARVEIAPLPTWAISGWFGVIVLAVLGALIWLLAVVARRG